MDKDQLIVDIKKAPDPFTKGKLIDSVLLSKTYTIKKLADRLDMTQAYICHYMRLSKIPQIIRDGFFDGQVSLSHVLIFSRLKSQTDMLELYEKVVEDTLTTIKLEELVREKLYGIKSIGTYITDFEKEQLSYNVQKMLRPDNIIIKQTRTKGKVTIQFKGSLVVTSAHIRKLFEYFDSNKKQ